MSSILRPFPEKDYNRIIREVGIRRYCIYEENEKLPTDTFSRIMEIEQYNCVIAGTGCSAESYTFKSPMEGKIIVPKGEEIIVFRLLRYDNSHGDPHYNANDQLIFPTKKGNIFRLSRNDAPDHFLKITDKANMLSVAEAYKLPEHKHGPIEKYSEKGAKLYIELEPLSEKEDKKK